MLDLATAVVLLRSRDTLAAESPAGANNPCRPLRFVLFVSDVRSNEFGLDAPGVVVVVVVVVVNASSIPM